MDELVFFLLVTDLICFLAYGLLRMRKFSKKNKKESEIVEDSSNLNPKLQIRDIESRLSELQNKVNYQEKIIKKLINLSE